jgi:hypothetical protein
MTKFSDFKARKAKGPTMAGATSDEVRSLLTDIQQAAVDGSQSVATVLRKCAVLASRLKNVDFQKWVSHELNGYPAEADVPNYRKIASQAIGTFIGPFGSQMNNAPIPSAILPEKQRAFGEQVRLRQPIASLEEAAQINPNKGNLEAPWPGNLIAIMQGKFANGWMLHSASQQIPHGAVTGLVDSVRNRVLEFTLQLEQEIPPGKTAAISAEIPAKVEHLYQTIINGNVTGNIATGSPGAVQSTNVTEGDIKALAAALKELGVPAGDTKELISIIEKKEDTQPFGPKTSAWLTKLGKKIGDGSIKVAENVSAGTVAKLILGYFGL